MDDLLLKSMVDNGNKISLIILCDQWKRGSKTELSNLNKKRIAREPPSKTNVKLSNSILKDY